MRSSLSLAVRAYLKKWWSFVSVPYNFLNIAASLLFLKASYTVAAIAAMFATKNANHPGAMDIIISHFPRIDTSIIHGSLSFFLFDLRFPLFILFIRYTPFAAKALACLILLRSATINLTNLGMPEGIVPINSTMTFGGDLFFSGHVANTFLLGLIFWKIKSLRYFFIAMSAVFAVSAVLGHYHYTIDVIAAPFFAYGIFSICRYIFKKDYQVAVDSKEKVNP